MDSKPGAVLYAKDVSKVSRFYAEVAALTIIHSEADHVILESAWFQLVVVAVPAKLAAAIQIATPPVRREATPIKLVLPVSSIAAVRLAAAHAGGELNPVEREWEFLGYRVCDGHDPEGNVVQFRVPAAHGARTEDPV